LPKPLRVLLNVYEITLERQALWKAIGDLIRHDTGTYFTYLHNLAVNCFLLFPVQMEILKI